MRAVQEQKVRIFKDQNQRFARLRIGSPVFWSIHPSQTRQANCRSSGERAASSSAAAKFTGEADSPAEGKIRSVVRESAFNFCGNSDLSGSSPSTDDDPCTHRRDPHGRSHAGVPRGILSSGVIH
jgi:hypothetical protein